MLDQKITNGTIVDGSGQPRFRGDVGIKNGRIVGVGRVTDGAAETIDAGGRIVAPGFIDIHTHYDAQAFWDPTLSPSCYHGVTTIFGGFCGFSIAPMTPEAAAYIRPMLARVEGMPLETLEAAVPWGSWSSFGEFLAKLEGHIGLNAGFYCGHSAIRRIVMGKRAVGDRATSDEVGHMKKILAQSIQDGALGFSTTVSPTHNDADGNPVPSRWADTSELLELAGVIRDHDGTGLELLPDLEFSPYMRELMVKFSLAGNRPVNWNALAITGNARTADIAKSQLSVSDFARTLGAEVIALTIPCTPDVFLNFRTGAGLDAMPGVWRELFKLSLSDRKARFEDAAVRRQMTTDANSMPADSPLMFLAQFEDYRVSSVNASQNKEYVGQRIGDIARDQSREPLDVMLNIALADDLVTTFRSQRGGEDLKGYELRAKLWRDDRTLIGASDAGAHLDMIDTFAFSTMVLEKGVREYQVIGLEQAIYQLTGRIARYAGLIDRGRIAPGYHADVVIFDDTKIASGPTYLRFDVPGNAGRLYADAVGVDHVFVNGVEIIRNGEHTSRLPGTILRAGRDTRTVLPGELRESPSY